MIGKGVARSHVGEAFRPPATDQLPPWLPTRTRNRLDLEVYGETWRFFVTMATAGRRPWFRTAEITVRCVAELRAACEREGFALLAYCFMPDHLHVLVGSEVDGANLVHFVHGYKQRTGWWFRNRYRAGGLKASPTTPADRPFLWQKSYYDHVLRQDEDVAQVVGYILANPVQAELVEEATQYAYSWSLHGSSGPAPRRRSAAE